MNPSMNESSDKTDKSYIHRYGPHMASESALRKKKKIISASYGIEIDQDVDIVMLIAIVIS